MIGSRGVGSNYGGIERVLDELCPRLGRLGHQVDVYGDPGAVFEDHGGVRAIGASSFGGKHFETLSRSLNALARAMGRYDVIHLHAVGPGILSAATHLFGQRSLVTIHGLDQKRDKWSATARACLTLAERALVANADQITVVSEPLRRYFIERYDVAASLIPNGMPRKTPAAPGAFLASFGLEPGGYVLFASRLTPEKGCHDLIAAFDALPQGTRLVVAGSSGEPDYLAALRAAADPAKVVFVGHRSGHELAELFSNAKLFVLPSYVEGMSMALLEALAYKVPALVTDIPENRVVVREHGFYVQPRDPAGLADALARLLESPDALGAARAALDSLDRPDWDAVAQRYDRLYRTPPRRPFAVAPPQQVGAR
ncbi:glycosyltransferase family 4 protein [Methylocella sp.]|uniref:glycosyltransferase family 4 protein n=1 Tax=Methylocella sp. TaxID=1978226 RepID=UPI0035B05C69